MTLVELMVAIFVTSILLAGVATVFTTTLRAARTVNIKASSTADARIAMEAMSRTLRVAYLPAGETAAIVSATANALSFYALINRTGVATAQPLPTLIEYSWDGTCLNEAQTPGRTLSVPSADGSTMAWDTGRATKCLARTSIAPVFAYYLSGSDPSAMTIPTGGLSATDLPTVESVQASVTIKDPANPSIGGIPMTDRVTLVNVLPLAGG
jgi:Tfp pilus assembly protein PilW